MRAQRLTHAGDGGPSENGLDYDIDLCRQDSSVRLFDTPNVAAAGVRPRSAKSALRTKKEGTVGNHWGTEAETAIIMKRIVNGLCFDRYSAGFSVPPFQRAGDGSGITQAWPDRGQLQVRFKISGSGILAPCLAVLSPIKPQAVFCMIVICGLRQALAGHQPQTSRPKRIVFGEPTPGRPSAAKAHRWLGRLVVIVGGQDPICCLF
ncbi:hypothetical protein [Mesorhizobium sp. GbtcB19]|uniref:hypothetical protein n=1 Tax=Mesorhizobium sp. GbtcB19 TaxID=2824764 RepID=UPI001C30AC16|nr:hypothetical protein [Mesorhizobium sp. GbtcB19]